MFPCHSCCFPNSEQARLCGHCGLYLKPIGDYVLRERIGTGGFAEVYRAVNRYTGHPAAIKLLHRKLIHDREIEQRFLREGQILRDLRSPNVVQIYDFGKLEDLGLYLMMEWLDGETLDVFVHRQPQKRLPFAEVIPLFSQLLYGLSRIHEQQVVHRDLKPKNFMVVHEKDKRLLKILDFGIAWVPGASDLTERGMFVGSTYFMAPEQFKAQKELFGPSTDLYVAGQLLVWMLTGQHIFTANTLQALAIRHCCEMPPTLQQLCPELSFSPAMEALIARALEKKPPGRFQSALEFLDAFKQAIPSQLQLSHPHIKFYTAPPTPAPESMADGRPQRPPHPVQNIHGHNPPMQHVPIQSPPMAGPSHPMRFVPMQQGMGLAARLPGAGAAPVLHAPQAALMVKERMKYARPPQAENAFPSHRPSSFEGALASPPMMSSPPQMDRAAVAALTNPVQQHTPPTPMQAVPATSPEAAPRDSSPGPVESTQLSTFRRKTTSIAQISPAAPSPKKLYMVWTVALAGAFICAASLAFFFLK